jgi:hypothetical protein
VCWWKNKKVLRLKSQIFVARKDDERKGWIRVSKNLRGIISDRAYVKVKVYKRKVYCQIRGTPNREGRIEINEWYRNALGWTDPPKEVELSIEEVGLLGRLHAFSSHPDDIVRVGIALGTLSVGLGLLSIIMALLPPGIRLMATSSSSDSAWGMAGLIIGLVLIPIVVFLLSQGISIFVRRPPKPLG